MRKKIIFLLFSLLLFIDKVECQTVIYQTGFENIDGVPIMLRTHLTDSLDNWQTNNRSIQGYMNYSPCGYVGWLLRNVWSVMDNSRPFNKDYYPISGRASLGMCMLFGDEGSTYYSYYRDSWCYYELWGAFDYWSTNLDRGTDRWAFRNISTVGYKDVKLDFDWKCLTPQEYQFEHGEVGYSLDGGKTFIWFNTGGDQNGMYYNRRNATHQTLTLPSECDNLESFSIAFRFVCNANNWPPDNETGPAFVIDNVSLTGTSIIFNCDIPKNFNATIGNPANGLSHYLNLNWTKVTNAQGYQLDVSPDGATNWANVFEGNTANFNDNRGDNPNKQCFYRIRAYQESTYCNYTYINRYTACDFPDLRIGNVTDKSMDVYLVAETPQPNPDYTKYSIFCTTKGQYLQLNGSFGTEVFFTRSQWGTVPVGGLQPNTTYCFYAKARNEEGDIRTEGPAKTVCAKTLDIPFVCENIKNFKVRIGSPANGLQHHLMLTWDIITKAEGYELQDSVTGGKWTTRYKNSESWFDYNCGDNPNKQYYFRIRAYRGTTNCNYSGIISRYTACDNPDLTTTNPTSTTIDLLLKAESPVTNPAFTKYFIKCTNKGKFVQADGSLGTDTIFQTRSQWGASIIVKGLDPSGVTYCFAAFARNEEGDLRNGGIVCASTTGCSVLNITGSPVNMSICTGFSDTLVVNVGGSVPVYFRWKKDGTTVYESSTYNTTIYYYINYAALSDAGEYECTVWNACTSPALTTNKFNISINETVSITQNLTDATKCEGEKWTVSVGAKGKSPLTYKWKKDDNVINGATTSSFNINTIAVSDTGKYKCEISNICGTKTSATAKLTILETVKVVKPEPLVTMCTGQEYTFNFSFTGSAPFTYQWLKDGDDISGASKSTYTINPLKTDDFGLYQCKVTNSCNTAFTDGTMLQLNQSIVKGGESPPLITKCAGEEINFFVTATGTNPISYQWKRNDEILDGATNSNFTIYDASVYHSSKYYQCEITNICGMERSNGTILVVNEPATITRDPDSVLICRGQNTEFSIRKKGVELIQYQWYKDNKKITGATASTYKVLSAIDADTGRYRCYVSNICGFDTSRIALLNLKEELVLTKQPSDIRLCKNDSAKFDVVAFGTNVRYQWQKNAVNIPNATTNSYKIKQTTYSDTAIYKCLITSDCGSINSNNVVLRLDASPAILTKTINRTVCSGDSVIFFVSLSDTNGVKFRWKKDNKLIEGASYNYLVIENISQSATGTYRLIAENNCGKDSVNAVLTLKNNMNIIQQPVDQYKCAGNQATFTVNISGTAPFYYKWIKESSVVNSGSSTSFSLSYTLNNVSQSDAAMYWCDITNDCGNIKTQIAKLILNHSLNIEEHPVPSTQTVCSGQKISYHIKVSDTTYTSYKWYKNGAFISGETNSAFVVQSAISNASYYCVATNSCGSITSNSASITVVPAAYILTDPVSKTVCENGVVNLRIIVSGIPLSYQWYRNNIMINNASTNQYIFNAKYSDMGDYYCVIANECGYDTSGVAIVKVNMPIQIVQQPYNLAKCFGEEAVFAFSLNDITGVTYQWLYNNINITGATNSEYKIETVDETNTGKYKCIATNACGTKTSNEVTLSVNSSFSIVSKSPNLSYCEGTDVKLFVETTGESVNYQWFKDEVEITGATNSSYYITNLYKASEGFYSCIVSNNCSSITNNIIVYVELKPQIYIAPLIQVKYVGDSVTYYLSPGGTGPFEYQWIKDDEPIENASESFYKIDSLVIDNSGKYTCIVSNKCGSTTVEISTLQVKYPEGFSIDGVLYYANVNNTPLTNTVVNLYNSEGVVIKTETTNNEGYYLFSGLSNGSYIVRPDIKKPWGGITPIDALLVNRYYLKIIPIKDVLRLTAADVDKNGIINPIDALYINRRYLKIIRSFKAGDWIYEEKEIIINGTNINSNIRAICVGDVDVNYIPTLKKLKKYKK